MALSFGLIDLLPARAQQIFLRLEEGMQQAFEDAFGGTNRRFAGSTSSMPKHNT
jgi:hypothetical protein